MTLFDAIVLGLIQGATEFLPISSSGHLLLAEKLLGFQDLHHYLLFDIICHVGTLCSILLIYRIDLLNLLRGRDKQTCALLAIAIAPLLPLTFFLQPLKKLYNAPHYLCFFFLITACLLYIGEKWRMKQKTYPLRDAFFIGCFQAAALLPGVSRSGSTISAATFLGWERAKAMRFSFLMAIPTICGACLLQTLDWIRQPHGETNVRLCHYLAGFTVSFLIGTLALRGIMRVAQLRSFRFFALYCLALSLISFFTFQAC